MATPPPIRPMMPPFPAPVLQPVPWAARRRPRYTGLEIRFWHVALGLTALVLLCVLIAVLRGPETGTAPGGFRAMGHQSAKIICSRVLIAPRTAEYPWESVTEADMFGHEGQRRIVCGEIHAQNAFGVPIRHRWTAEVWREGDRLRTVWFALDGETLYTDPAVRLAELREE